MKIKSWLKFLVDPERGTRLQLEKDAQGFHLKSDTGIIYRIIDGIPRFTPQQEDDATRQTAESFGKKWTDPSLYSWKDDPVKKEALQEQLVALLGNRQPDQVFLPGTTVLNAGCGIAWSEWMFNPDPQCLRFAVDISRAVETAAHLCSGLDNVFIAQADLFSLPFPPDFFDVIFSCGVLHHTPDPRECFRKLVSHLKPGGHIGIYIYNIKPFVREIADREIREITTKMSYDECLAFSRQLSKLGKALQKIETPLEIEEDIPLLGIKKGRYNVQKFIYDHFLKCYYNEKLGSDYSDLVNVDWYHPEYASHHSRDEIELWFGECGIERPLFLQPEGWEHSGYFVSGVKKKYSS